MLSGSSQRTEWKFPKSLSKCPVQYCRPQTGNRSAAIAHFRSQHAMYYTRCSICDKPIMAKNFKRHCRTVHSNVEMHFDMNKKPKHSEQEKHETNMVRIL